MENNEQQKIINEVFKFIDFTNLSIAKEIYLTESEINLIDIRLKDGTYFSKHGLPTRVLMNVFLFKDDSQKSFVTENTLFIEESEFKKFSNLSLQTTGKWIDSGIDEITKTACKLLDKPQQILNDTNWEFHSIEETIQWLKINSTIKILNKSNKDVIENLEQISQNKMDFAKRWLNSIAMSATMKNKLKNKQFDTGMFRRSSTLEQTSTNCSQDYLLNFFTRDYIENVCEALKDINSDKYKEIKNNFLTQYKDGDIEDNKLSIAFVWLNKAIQCFSNKSDLESKEILKLGRLFMKNQKDFPMLNNAIIDGLSNMFIYKSWSYLSNNKKLDKKFKP